PAAAATSTSCWRAVRDVSSSATWNEADGSRSGPRRSSRLGRPCPAGLPSPHIPTLGGEGDCPPPAVSVSRKVRRDCVGCVKKARTFVHSRGRAGLGSGGHEVVAGRDL